MVPLPVWIQFLCPYLDESFLFKRYIYDKIFIYFLSVFHRNKPYYGKCPISQGEEYLRGFLETDPDADDF